MDLYIFGTKRNSEMASFYFSRDYPHLDFCGYIEDSPIEQTAFGFPVFSSDEFQKTKSPREVVLFAPLTKGSAEKRCFPGLRVLDTLLLPMCRRELRFWIYLL